MSNASGDRSSRQPKLICDESYGSSGSRKDYVLSEKGYEVIDKSPKFTSFNQFFRSVFLPQGYPESVSEDYLTYQIWDTIQAFASSITGTLAAQAMLKGVGVGDVNASLLGATLTWIIKDGTGMLGRLFFTWMQGSQLDCDAKKWRLFADILNDFAIFLEILAPGFPAYFTALVCVAGVSKSIVGVAGGATRAALTQHQARRNNMADVSAKDGSQETLVNLAALVCSLILVPLVTGKQMVIWVLFLLFTLLHLYANYSAVTSVVMDTLNQARLHIILRRSLQPGASLLPRHVNALEPVLRGTRRKFTIKLGTSFSDICKSVEDVDILDKTYGDGDYLLNVNMDTRVIGVVLSTKASVRTQLLSCVQAELINLAFDCPQEFEDVEKLRPLLEEAKKGSQRGVLRSSAVLARAVFGELVPALRGQGWDVDVALLGADEWRASWDWSSLAKKDK